MTKPMSVRSILTTGVGKSTTMVVFDGNKIHLVYASFVRTVANCFCRRWDVDHADFTAGLRGLLRTDLRFYSRTFSVVAVVEEKRFLVFGLGGRWFEYSWRLAWLDFCF